MLDWIGFIWDPDCSDRHQKRFENGRCIHTIHHDQTVEKVLEIEDDESLSFNVSPISDLEKVVEERIPHFCIDATTATLESVLPHFSRLLSMGVHIITMAGEAMFPDTKYTLETYQIWKTLDQMAKDNGAIVVGGAYPDGVIS